MKAVLGVLLSALLCVQSVYAMPVGTEILYEEEQEENTVENEGGEEQENIEQTGGLEISAPSVILMEASTGSVIYEKDADTKRPPASVTKIMTLLLIFDAIEEGKISLEDKVTTSEYAASMGGSQVFLEVGEMQTVDTLLKCISVASANDACVAMAEYIAGNEEEFVRRMNERARELGMESTNFVNCNGLDAEGHETSARDIALMSRELITKYPQIHEYCMVWMENITHTTGKGSSEFGLTNTNKLVRQYEYTTGLKTGSTEDAKFCVSATAEKNGVELIAVVMAAENSKLRFKDATTLLNYGFGKCQVYRDKEPEKMKPIAVEGGVQEKAACGYAQTFTYMDTTGANLNEITKSVEIKETVKAPVKKGEQIGKIIYKLNGKEIGSTMIIAEENVKKAGIWDHLKRVFKQVCI